MDACRWFHCSITMEILLSNEYKIETSMKTQFITSPDGVRLAYDVTGQGPGLMLLHGAGKDRQDWYKAGYVERLESDFTVITVDVRGSGDSEFLTQISDFTIDKICDDLFAVADLGLQLRRQHCPVSWRQV